MEISVVVPVFNSAKYLPRCIEALLGQEFPRDSYEIIMVDNNSTDDSVDIIRRCAGVRLISEPKQGSYAARNAGLREACGKLIAFTDADCAPAPDWLAQIARALADPEAGIVLGSRYPARADPLLTLLTAHVHEMQRYIFSQT